MRRFLFFSLIGLGVLGASGAAGAAEQAPDPAGWYGGIGLSGDLGHGGQDGGHQGSISGLAGYQFNPAFGAEVQLSDSFFGHRRPPLTEDGDPPHRDFHVSAAAYGVAYLPLTPKLKLLARAGIGDSTFTAGSNGSREHSDLASLNVGIGAVYALSPTNALRLDVTHKDFEHHAGETDETTLSFIHRF